MDKKIFKQDAKTIVDLAFDSKLFKDSVTRDHMNVYEDFVEQMLSSRFESYIRAERILEDLKRIESKP